MLPIAIQSQFVIYTIYNTAVLVIANNFGIIDYRMRKIVAYYMLLILIILKYFLSVPYFYIVYRNMMEIKI